MFPLVVEEVQSTFVLQTAILLGISLDHCYYCSEWYSCLPVSAELDLAYYPGFQEIARGLKHFFIIFCNSAHTVFCVLHEYNLQILRNSFTKVNKTIYKKFRIGTGQIMGLGLNLDVNKPNL